MLDTIRELGHKLNSYTNETTTEDRTRVLNKTTGEEGIVVSTEDDKITVKWLKTGSMDEHSKKDLEKVNSDICYAERAMTIPTITSFLNTASVSAKSIAIGTPQKTGSVSAIVIKS